MSFKLPPVVDSFFRTESQEYSLQAADVLQKHKLEAQAKADAEAEAQAKAKAEAQVKAEQKTSDDFKATLNGHGAHTPYPAR